VGETILAMLRCVKTSPGLRPSTVVSGTRESLQPIQRMAGDWPWALVGKNLASLWAVSEAQRLLLSRACWKADSARGGGGC